MKSGCGADIVIYKYEAPNTPHGVSSFNAPYNSWFHHVAYQRGAICAWAQVDRSTDVVTWKIVALPTGASLSDLKNEAQFIGTLLLNNGDLVLHYYAQRLSDE